MALSLPSDMFIPELALQYAGFEFYTSLAAWDKFMGIGPESPIQVGALKDATSHGIHIQVPIWKDMGETTFLTRIDRTSSSDATPTAMSVRNDRGVTVSRKGLVSFGLQAAWTSGQSPEQFSAEFGRQLGRAMLRQMQSTAINALYGALAAMTTTAHTLSIYGAASRTNLSAPALSQVRLKMGDRGDAIKGWLTRSEPAYDLLQATMNVLVAGVADKAYQFGQNASLGLPVAVVDEAILVTAVTSAYDKYYTLGLGSGCIRIDPLRLDIAPPWMNPKSETREYVLRADLDYAVQVPGMQYATASSNPTDATLALSTYWTPVYTDAREVKAVILEHNYSGA